MAQQKSSATLQAGKFGLVGILNTVIDYTLFIAITKLFSIPLDRVWVAKLISGSVAMINSFFFNRTWVFHANKKDAAGQAFRFFVSTIVAVYIIQLGLVQFFSSNYPDVGVFFNNLANSLGVIALAPSILTKSLAIKTVAFGLATVASLTWNFVLYKFWAFK